MKKKKSPLLEKLTKRPALWIGENEDSIRITMPSLSVTSENNGEYFDDDIMEWVSGEWSILKVYQNYKFVRYL